MKVTNVDIRPITNPKRNTPELYIFPTAKGNVAEGIMENLLNRRDRPYKEWKKLIPEILKQAKVPADAIENVDARWSQKCGCACGCSPGFKLRGLNIKSDLFVDVED